MSVRIRCTCEFKDLGIAFQLVREDPACAVHHPAPVSARAECWCEWVDIGVGEQRVAENPACPEHFPDAPDEWGPDCPTSPGPVPALDGSAPELPCDWDPNCTGPEGCPDHDKPRCYGCGNVADHGASCVM